MDREGEATEPLRVGIDWSARNETRHYIVRCDEEDHVFTMSASSGPWFIDHRCGAAQLVMETAMFYGSDEVQPVILGPCAIIAQWWMRQGIERMRAQVYEGIGTDDVRLRMLCERTMGEDELQDQRIQIEVRTTTLGALLLSRIIYAVDHPQRAPLLGRRLLPTAVRR